MKRRGLGIWVAMLAILALTALAMPAAADDGNEGQWSWGGIWAAIVELVGGFVDEPEYNGHVPIGGGAEKTQSSTPPPPPPDEDEFLPEIPIGG